MDYGRVVCLLIATKTGNVIYERFYNQFSESEKAEIRAGLDAASQPYLYRAHDDVEYVGRFKAGVVVFVPTADVVIYALGTGEYDELSLGQLLFSAVRGLRESLAVPLSERSLVDKYSKVALVLDELVNEGIIDETNPMRIVAGTKLTMRGK